MQYTYNYTKRYIKLKNGNKATTVYLCKTSRLQIASRNDKTLMATSTLVCDTKNTQQFQ